MDFDKKNYISLEKYLSHGNKHFNIHIHFFYLLLMLSFIELNIELSFINRLSSNIILTLYFL